MYISVRVLAFSAIAISASQAQYVIDGLSFGHNEGSISPNLRGIPNWHIQGEGHTPDLLSDRVILTPPYPGNRRGALWADYPVQYSEWQAQFFFRASGPERGGGNLQIWYTKDGQQGVGLSSLYTATKFDGLALLMDQYGGRGGTIRGFLNDGTVSYKDHHSVDSLSFGQCNYPYRNLGRFSVLTLKQTADYFQVTVDGNPCFRSDKVKLPAGYFFGISAASAETPDSFEVNKFIVSTTNAATREDPNRQPPPQQQQQQQQEQQQPAASSDIPLDLSDTIAASIKSQQDQFADLHNRLQIVNHQVNNIWRELEKLSKRQDERHIELTSRVIPTNDRVDNMARSMDKIERIVLAIQKDVEGKDYKEHLSNLQNAIKDTHISLTEGLPQAMTKIVTGSAPRMGMFLFIAVAVQVMILGGYLLYKKRRNNAPKKYL
ncbi:concanavalin A-like lectin/glucanase [Lepidopterella palustris CBS 459.81]|uniref:Concanavalin A-like lectin/glucanase n=1 Tax=Lepidopterella palustris CBS 459.81 TaxID=1314670 RepID=A0A8E2EEZ2_9PEZI|nr:concanavalin A-like lectin/glucanase [Lepidopterella palustris CBS 459.81]